VKQNVFVKESKEMKTKTKKIFKKRKKRTKDDMYINKAKK